MQFSSMSRLSSSIFALKSSMVSNTTARPRCLSSLGVAADGLMTAPSGARLPRRTAMPAFALNGSSNALMTSRFQHGASAMFSPMRLAVDGQRVLLSTSAISLAAPRAGRRRNRNPPSGIWPEGCRFTRQGSSEPSLSQSSSVERHADAPGDRQQVHHGVGRAADRGVGPDRVLERLAREDLRQHAGLRAPSRRCAGP